MQPQGMVPPLATVAQPARVVATVTKTAAPRPLHRTTKIVVATVTTEIAIETGVTTAIGGGTTTVVGAVTTATATATASTTTGATAAGATAIATVAKTGGVSGHPRPIPRLASSRRRCATT